LAEIEAELQGWFGADSVARLRKMNGKKISLKSSDGWKLATQKARTLETKLLQGVLVHHLMAEESASSMEGMVLKGNDAALLFGTSPPTPAPAPTPPTPAPTVSIADFVSIVRGRSREVPLKPPAPSKAKPTHQPSRAALGSVSRVRAVSRSPVLRGLHMGAGKAHKGADQRAGGEFASGMPGLNALPKKLQAALADRVKVDGTPPPSCDAATAPSPSLTLTSAATTI
jgi:hypothetical protein